MRTWHFGLKNKLVEDGVAIVDPDQEDWGWYLGVSFEEQKYFIGISGNSDNDDMSTNQGEWRLMIENKRIFYEKLFGKNKISKNDNFISKLENLLKTEADFSDVRKE